MTTNAKHRIWHVRNSDRLGGPERLLLDQCALAAADLAPTIVCFAAQARPHPLLDAAEARGIDTRRLAQGGSYDPRPFRRLRRELKASPPELLVGHDYKADLVLRVAARGLGIPRVSIVHGFTGENLKIRLYEALDRRLLRGMDAVVVVSAALRDELVSGGVAPERVHVIANAINVNAVAAAAEAGRDGVRAEWGVADAPVVLALGRLSPEKGQDVLLEAFASARHDLEDDVRLVLVGAGASRPALERRAEGLGITARVHFAGWRDDPHACLGAADVVVLPSRTEGLPLAVLEAMAAGRPVIATRVGAVSEVLDEGSAGWLVPPDDPDAIRHALTEVLRGPDARRSRVAAARARVAAAYGAERQTRQLEALYRHLSPYGVRTDSAPFA